MAGKKSKFSEEEIKEARELLQETLDKVDTIYTVLYRVSRDGMTRDIAPLVAVPNREEGKPPVIWDLSWIVAKLGIFPRARSERGLTLGGAGMDMGFHLVYTICQEVYGLDGGYSKNHRWL